MSDQPAVAAHSDFRIDARTAIGAVSLTVSDLARSLAFYRESIGLQVLEGGSSRAVLGAGDTPLLYLYERPGARLVRRATGLYHFALRVPSRLDLARSSQRLIDTQASVQGASDHLVSEALYLGDPDGHGIEIYRDRPRDTWHDGEGNLKMDTQPLDIDGVLAELAGDTRPRDGQSLGTVMGHVHLQVANISASRQFYSKVLGFDTLAGNHSVAFVSAGGYHHHIGMNTWVGMGAPPPPENAARLLHYEIMLPDQDAMRAVLERLDAAGNEPQLKGSAWFVRDPSQIGIVLRIKD